MSRIESDPAEASVLDVASPDGPPPPFLEGLVPLPFRGSTLRALAHGSTSAREGRAELFGSTAPARVATLLAALFAHDPATFRHSTETAALCRRVGHAMGLDAAELGRLEMAALVHDVGKVLVPHRTLFKPSLLTSAEWRTVKQHPVTGANLLSGVPGLEPVADVVLNHHERPDGTGYPYGRQAGEIPVASGVIGVCDAYQAMTSERSYQRARPNREAIWEIERHASTQFEPRAVRGLVELDRGSAPAPPRRTALVDLDLSSWGRVLSPAAAPAVA